jgi:peptidoglycan/xylan/chitin deacetylase (PgdA/CDA1 family)
MTQDSRLLLEEQKPDDSIPPISVLMYHQVGRFQAPKTHRASFCHIRRFRAQMRFLKKFGYHVISLQQALVGLFQGISLPRKSVVLTFDDGYQNFREYAFPVLQEHGFPTTVFLVSGLLGRKAKWLEDDGRYAPPLMDTTTIRELSRQGVSFGSHTVSHVRLSQVNIGRMREEIFSSKAKLEDLLGERVTRERETP